jgi:hypothetical protein
MLAIGNYSRNALGSCNEFVQEQWTDTAIEARFDKYGGIIRRALPENLLGLEKHKIGYQQAVDTSVVSLPEVLRTLNANQISSAGSYLVQWGPTVSDDGDINFGGFKNTFASESIRDTILEKYELLTYEKLKVTLVGCKRDHSTNVLTSNIFETFAGLSLLEDPQLKKQWDCKKLCRGLVPFAAMEAGVLYYPRDVGLPAADYYFKKDGVLYLVQASVTQGEKVMPNGALAVFLQKIAFPEEGQIKFIYFTFSDNSAFCLEYKTYAPNKCVHAYVCA